MIGLKPIAAYETVHIDIKKLRDEQIPDERGRTIPLHIQSGQLQWTLRRKDNLPEDNARANLSLIGRSEQVDLTRKIANNYSCQNCCSGDFRGGRIEPALFYQVGYILAGKSRDYLAIEDQVTCYGYNYEIVVPTTVIASWNSNNTGVADVFAGRVFANTAGSATISASWQARSYYTIPCGGGGGGNSPLFIENESKNCENENKIKGEVDDSGEVPNIAPCGSCSSRGINVTAQKTVFVQCAVPTNFRRVDPGIDQGNGTLFFNNFSWDSSTGNLADLSSCQVGEFVTYPSASSQYYPPSPPFPFSFFNNPTIGNVPAAVGSLNDHHRTPGEFVKPYSASSFTAIQYYRYSCPCMNNGAPVNFMGPIDIVRSVTQNSSSSWKFTITKLGYSATIDPLP